MRQALAHSGLGALLVFDQHSIRDLPSTVIGEWARDKLTRWSLLTGNGEPWVWDFGSAARHHQLHAPWIPERQALAGMVGLRGAVSPKAGLFARAVASAPGAASVRVWQSGLLVRLVRLSPRHACVQALRHPRGGATCGSSRW